MKNLLEETKEILAEHDKVLADINFIKDGGLCESLNEYKLKYLLNVNYDNGFGGVEVNPRIKLVGRDFWLERHEYDGSEWWEYKIVPTFDQPSTFDRNNIVRR